MGESYVVTGFYTPNYGPLATAFRTNLDAHTIPHHLYAVAPLGGTWLAQTMRKPEIVLRAMADHPDATVILCDVDCQVSGPLKPLLAGAADVKLFLRTKVAKGAGVHVNTSSRVLVVRQTPAAVRLIEAWQARCKAAIDAVASRKLTPRHLLLRNLGIRNDESLLLDAIANTSGVLIEMLPLSFAGAEAGIVPGALVSHDSAHDKAQPAAVARNAVKRIRRRIVSAIVGRSYLAWKYGKSRSFRRWG